mmetsp:Transcript_3895/g.8588  ORF Transcript_3895/g.8588 Transcript_3895/m.8588 type:complete len:345 (-) Transcript_3895:182-1216(-)
MSLFIRLLLVLPFAQAFARISQRQSHLSSLRLSGLTSDYLLTLATTTDLPGDTVVTVSRPTTRVDGLDDNLSSRLLCGDVLPMMWDGGQQYSENAFRVGLPPQLLGELLAYANRMGITDYYRGLVVEGKPFQPGQEAAVTFLDHNWMVHRPQSHWASNMHWISPADETAHNDYLQVLSAGGFDRVLERVGAYFDLKGLSAYHLSFIGVSHCEKGFIHADVNDSGRRAFNMIVPLILEEEGPELEILSDDEATTRYYKYEYNVASMVGDSALHATASCDYRTKGSMRMAATVYIGDISRDNVNHLLLSLTQAYPPVGDAQHLLDRAGGHWSSTDPSKKLPLPITV